MTSQPTFTTWAIAGVLTASIAGLVAVAGISPPLMLVNESASVPRGLYVRSGNQTLRPGRLVALFPPPAARSYLAGLGWPPNMRLLKRVAAIESQTVCAEPGRLRTARVTVPVLARDRRGVPLAPWRGCRRLGAEEVLLLGDTASSFDSRYFGPVPRWDIQAAYTEVLRW